MSDKKVLGSSLLIKFNENLVELINVYSEYVVLEIDLKTKNIDYEKAKEYANYIRKYLFSVYIDFYTINKIVNKTENKKIEELIKTFKNNIIINPDEIETFIKEISFFVYSDAIQELINSSKKIMEDLFNLENEKQNK